MSKLTDFYAHKAAIIEKGEPIDPCWEQLEDQLLREELLPELTELLRLTPQMRLHRQNLEIQEETEVSRWLSGTHNLTLATICKISAALDEKVLEVANDPLSPVYEFKSLIAAEPVY